MGMVGIAGRVVAAGRPPARRRAGEQGVGLVDAVVSIVILMVMLIPVFNLLTTTGNVISTNQYRQTAEQLAQGTINQLQQNAVTSGATGGSGGPPPGSTNPVQTLLAPWNVAPSIQLLSAANTWPSSGWTTSTAITQTVGTVWYVAYAVGGWCMTTSGATSWASYTGTAAAAWGYFVTVKVIWGEPSGTVTAPTSVPAQGGSVVQTAQLQTQAAWSSSTDAVIPTVAPAMTFQPPASGNSDYCPVGLT